MFRFPSSGVLLERAADLLGLDDSLDQSLRKALQRYSDDQSPTGVSMERRAELVRALVNAWLGSPDERLSGAILDSLAEWDALSFELNSGSVRPEVPGLCVYPLVRMAVLDLALRWVAAFVQGLSASQRDRPSLVLPALDADWIHPDALARTIDRLRGKITIEKLAADANLSMQTLERWRSGELAPRSENLRDLAHAISPEMPARAERQLRIAAASQTAQSALGTLLDDQLLDDLRSALVRVANVALEEILKAGTPRAHLGEIALRGAHSPAGGHLSEMIAARALHREVREDLLAIRGAWLDRARLLLRTIGNTDELGPDMKQELDRPKGKEALAQLRLAILKIGDPFTLPAERATLRAAVTRLRADPVYRAIELGRMADWAESRGDIATAVKLSEESLQLDPSNARRHFTLGSYLGMAQGAPGLFESALEHLREAARLDPSWDRPPSEIGVVLSNYGRLREAEQQYASCESVAGGWAHYQYGRGVNAMWLEDWPLAERCLRRSLELESRDDVQACLLVVLEKTHRGSSAEARQLRGVLEKRHPGKWRALVPRCPAAGQS